MVKRWDKKYSELPLKWFILYNKEAHLEWQAKKYKDRVDRAIWHGQLCSRVTGVQEIATVLVDNVDNKINDAYGTNPNGVTIIDPKGKIIFYQDWFRYGDVDKFLAELFKDRLTKKEAKAK